MAITLDGTNGITTPTYGGADTSEYLVPVTQFKNRIINGAMQIDQRNAGASVTLDGNGVYPVDRWRCDEATDGGATGEQVQDAPAGFVDSLKFTTTTADGTLASGQYMAANQFIEGYNTADFNWGTANAKTVTLSFWVKSSLTGTFAGGIDNNDGNRSYVFNYSILSANTWEYKTITINGDTSGTWNTGSSRGLGLRFGLGAGTSYDGTVGSWQSGSKFSSSGSVSVIGTLNATWQITGVQLEVGSTATSFDYRPYGTELQLCQRYFQINKRISGITADTTTVNCNLIYYCTMRTAPTLGQQGVIQINDNGVNSTQSSTSITSLNSDNEGTFAQLGNFSGLTANRPAIFRLNANTNGITLSAEL